MRLFEAKLPQVLRYCQLIHTTPFGLFCPVWTDDEEFSIRHHVRQGDLLAERHELTEGLVVRSLVPVSVRVPDEARAITNRASAVLVNLSVGEPDPLRRLGVLRGR